MLRNEGSNMFGSSTTVLASEVETQNEDENNNLSNALMRKIRLKFDSSFGQSQVANDGTLQLLSAETGLAIRDNELNLGEMINFLLNLFGQIDVNTNLLEKLNIKATSSNQSTSIIKEQLLGFLVKKIEELTRKLRIVSQTTEKQIISVITLLIRLVRNHFPSRSLKFYYRDFVNLIKQTRNNKILNEILNIWNNTPSEIDIEEIRDSLLPFLKKNLSNSEYRVRSKCLRILSFHYTKDEKLLKNKIVKILLNFMDDQDARVRITSLELLILLNLNGINIPVEYYEDIKPNLFDDYDQVRLLTSQLITLLAFSYPEYMIQVSNNQDDDKIRLADDVFSKICFMINDVSLEVKVCAGSLLGKIDLVSSRFLLQTLDKKLMSDLKVRKFQKSRQKQLVSSEWSATASTEVSSAADSVITDGDNLNLITSGACGAFIHGLEDEFLEVRAEAVDSLCALALKCPQFAAKSIDFLVDMFNDEIETVRLKAILALTKILHYVLLGDDQIDIVISVIEDSSFDVRESLKDLLGNCKLATKIGLKKAIQALFNNIKRYQIDKSSIWRCFQNLGRNHSKFVMSLVSYLVSLHPFIDVIEPDINDIYYTSSLILLFNAVNENSTLLPMLPRYVINHYFFLKLKLPDLIPNIKLIENSSNSINSLLVNEFSEIEQKAGEVVSNFFQKTKSNLSMVSRLSHSRSGSFDEGILRIFESINHDIEYLARIDSNLSAACEIMKQFMDCYLVVKKLESKNYTKEKSDYFRLIQIEEALLTSIKLIVLYKGYNPKEKVTLLKMYLYLRALYLKEFFVRKTSFNANNNINYNLNSYLKLNIFKKDLIKECRLFASLLKFFDKVLDKKLKAAIFQIVEELPFDFRQFIDTKSLEFGSSSEPFDLDLLFICDKSKKCFKESLVLLEPVDNVETPIRFTPGLISIVKVKAILNNFQRFDNLFIQVTYSDNDKQFIPIDSSSVKALNSNKHILDTNVNLPNLALTDTCSIKLCLTKLIDEYTDVKECLLERASTDSDGDLLFVDDSNHLSASTSTNVESSQRIMSTLNEKSLRSASHSASNSLTSIELSNFVKIYFEPLAKKYY